VITGEGHAIQVACRAAGVSESGFLCAADPAPSQPGRSDHAWLTNVITKVHACSSGTYGAPQVHAELTIGRGITVGHSGWRS
jgi:putative transposase